MPPGVLFLTLKVFSATGGIERVCRIAGKAIYEECVIGNTNFSLYSMYDSDLPATGSRYFPSSVFTGFGVNKPAFMRKAIVKGCKSKLVILSHINLLVVGWLIKKIKPAARIVLITHGIEVWEPLSKTKKRMLQCCDEIVAVSEFTREKLVELQGAKPSKCTVLNNCLDPFLTTPENISGATELRKRYGFSEQDTILFAMTRLSAKERLKGYDKVMKAMVEIADPGLKYLIAGKYDEEEKSYIDELIVSLKLQEKVVLTGFIPEDEVAAHFTMADHFVMPSLKEGFGIVFIEAMYYGLPVIAGDKDGSVDALRNGQLGMLVDPFDNNAIRNAIRNLVNDPGKYRPNMALLQKHFSYNAYRQRVHDLLARHIQLNNNAENNPGREWATAVTPQA